jgi:hypothetical protein
MARARVLVSTVLLISAACALALPLVLLATPGLRESPIVDTIAFVALIGLFPLLAISAIIAAVVIIVRNRAWQPLIEIAIACLLLVVASFNGTP